VWCVTWKKELASIEENMNLSLYIVVRFVSQSGPSQIASKIFSWFFMKGYY
jgi:hypothetical protein